MPPLPPRLLLIAALGLVACTSDPAAPVDAARGGSGPLDAAPNGGSGGVDASVQGGAGGAPARLDAGPADSAAADLAVVADASPSGPDAAITNDAGLAPLEECPTPSLDRLQAWNATGEGTTRPMSGSLLVKEGDHFVARQEFLPNRGGDPWHVLEIFLGNTFEFSVDLSQSRGFTLTYSSTAELWAQLRPAFHYDGGAQWVTRIPATGGQTQRLEISFDPTKWSNDLLGRPSWTFAMALKAARGLLFVGDKPNVITFSGLRIDGYVPMCR